MLESSNSSSSVKMSYTLDGDLSGNILAWPFIVFNISFCFALLLFLDEEEEEEEKDEVRISSTASSSSL